jgi:hypothetical protein
MSILSYCNSAVEHQVSPGRVLTVTTEPASGPVRCIGRIRDPVALMLDMESLTFTTGIERNFSTVSGLTLRVLFRILNPIVIVSSRKLSLLLWGLFSPVANLRAPPPM